MQDRKEEVLAATLWAFIERLREEGDPRAAGLDGLTAGDASELASLFRTAQDLGLALDVGSELASGAEERVTAAIAERRRRNAPARGFPAYRRLPLQGLLRRAAFASAVAATLAAGILIGTGLPTRDPVGRPPAAVAALTHEQTRRLVPRLMAGTLSPAQARAVLWHLAHCDECFAVYRQMLRVGEGRGATRLAEAGREAGR